MEFAEGFAYGSDNVRNVRNRGTRGSSQVQDSCLGFNPAVLNTADNGCGKLRTERIPDSVFNFGSVCLL